MGTTSMQGAATMAADQTAEHLVHVRNEVVKVQDSRLQYLLAAEDQKLTGQGCCPFPSSMDLLGDFSGGLAL